MDIGTTLLAIVVIAAAIVVYELIVTKTGKTFPPAAPIAAAPLIAPPKPPVQKPAARKAVVKQVVHSAPVVLPSAADAGPAQRGASRGKAKVTVINTVSNGTCVVCGTVGCTKHN